MTTDAPVAPPPVADRPAAIEEPDRRRARALALLLPAVLLVMAGTLRFYRLGEPDRIYFDETYYANDANQYLTRGVEEGFAVHPPIGKWLLAGGISAFGFDAFGWRFGAAVAGTAMVWVAYLAGARLFRNRAIAALTAVLVCVDGLLFTMSRIAMLDIFLGLFVLLGFWLLLVDRDLQWAGVPAVPLWRGPAPAVRPPDTDAATLGAQTEAPAPVPDAAVPAADAGAGPWTPEPAAAPAAAPAVAPRRATVPRRPHWPRWLAGVSFGLALATKWSALLPIAAAGLFVLCSEIAWRRRLTGRPLVKFGRIVASGILTLVLVPLVVYVASYGGWFANFSETRVGIPLCPGGVCTMGPVGVTKEWVKEQRAIYRFHRDLKAEHPYRASARTWPTMSRPVAYYYEACDAEKKERGECLVDEPNVAEILGIGNPVIWWAALPAYPLLLFFAVRDRDWRAWAILLFLLIQYLPWLPASRPLFLFYMTPAVAFIVLSLAYICWRALAKPFGRLLPAVLTVAAVFGFLYWYPIYVGLEIPRPQWDDRIWFQSWI